LEGNIKTSGADLIQQSGQFNKKIQELTATIATRDQTIAGLEATVSSDKKIHDDQVKTIKQCNEQIAEQAKNITDLGETIKGLKDTITQVETGRKHYQDEFQNKNTELHNMTQLKNKLQEQIDAATPAAALKVVQDQVVALTQEKSDLDKRILDKGKEIGDLKTEIDKLQTQLASRSSSDDRRKDTKQSKPRKTDAEHKAEFQSKNRELLQELLRQLLEQVDIPVDKPSS
jgi:chromosome segregation ATPase